MKRKEKKKLPLLAKLFIALIVLVAIFLSGAILSEPVPDANEPADSTKAADTGETENETVGTADAAIVDNDAMSVYYVGAEDQSSLGVFYVVLKIENKTEAEIVVNLESADVDGQTIPMITTGIPLVIRPGNSGQTGFIFSMANLSISSMEEAEEATFRVVARNNETYEIVSQSDLVTVKLH